MTEQITLSAAELLQAAQNQPLALLAKQNALEDLESKVPDFPTHLLPSPMREIVEETSMSALTPHCLTAAVAISTIGDAAGAGVQCFTSSAEDAVVRANVPITAIAPSGMGKSASTKPIRGPLDAYAEKTIEDWNTNARPSILADIAEQETKIARLKKDIGGRETDAAQQAVIREEMREAHKALEVAKGMEARKPVFNAGEATKEALVHAMAGQPGEAISSFSADARNIIGVVAGRYSSGDSDESIYLSGYSGDSIQVTRRNAPSIVLKNPCLNMCWMIQPDKALEMLGNSAMTESGLIPRMLFFNTEAEAMDAPEVRHRISDRIREEWKNRVEDLCENYRMQGDTPKTIRPTSEAFEYFRRFDNWTRQSRRTGGEHKDIESYAARWAENAWRLGVVLHAAEHGSRAHDEPFTLAHAERAVEVMRWFIGAQLRLLSTGRTAKMQKRLHQLRELVASSPKSRRDLANSHGFQWDEVERFVRGSHGILEIVTKPTTGSGGRPAQIVQIRTQAAA